MARPRTYTPEIIDKVKEYLASCGNCYKQIVVGETPIANGQGTIPVYKTILEVKLPSIEGLALHLGISKETVYAWEKEKDPVDEKALRNPEFSDVISDLRAKQAEMLMNNAIAGTYNPIISKVLLTKHGYREGIDQTTDDKPLPTPILNGISTNHSDEENIKTA